MEGVPSIFSFIRQYSVLSKSCSAARKDRESVQRAASVKVTTAVPAEPSKPDIHSLPFQCFAVYSLWCASAVGKIQADKCSCIITSRKAHNLASINVFIILFAI